MSREELLRDSIKNNFDKNLFIKAGAGAGKSSMLVERIVNQIRGGDLPESIVAITFTNKAAEELKGRILKKLNDSLSDDSICAKERENIEMAFENFDRMQISTIHSFCNVLLKEQMFSSKLRKDVEMLQNDDLTDYLDKFFQKQLTESIDINLSNFYYNFGRKPKVLLNAFMAIAEVDDESTIMYRKDLLDYSISDYEQKIEEIVEKAKETIVSTYNRVMGSNDVTSINNLPKDYPLYAGLYKEDKEFITQLGKCLENHKFNASRKKSVPVEFSEIDDALVVALTDEYKKAVYLIEEKKDYQHALVMDIAMKIRAKYRNKKDSKYISNDQLLQRAYKLIAENKSAWQYYNNKYSRIYVDEFQDTDHIQAGLILRLCSKEFGSSELVAGKLVVVGDAKQSIYRFRGADLPEYEAVEKIIESQKDSGEIINLEYNFRSSPLVIKWVNEQFGKIRVDGSQVIENYQPMDAKRALKDKCINDKYLEGVYYVGDVTSPIEKTKTQSANDVEAEYLVSLIKNLVGNYEIYDKEIGKYRKIEYRDFLLLSHTTTKMGQYADKFTLEGIPVNLSGKINIQLEEYLNNYARLYNYLAHKGIDKNANATIELANYGSLADSSNDIIALVNETNGFNGVELAYYLLNHLEYVLSRNTTISKQLAKQAQTRLIQMVEKVCEENENDALILADEFFSYLEVSIEREMALEDKGNMVRFMNVHKSKGLEGTIVVICDRRRESDKKSSHIHREGTSIQLFPAFSSATSANSFGESLIGYNSNPTILAEAKSEEDKEYIRLEYVVATRAKEVLIVMPSLDKNNNCFLGEYSYDDVNHISLSSELFANNTVSSDDITKRAVKEEVAIDEEQKKVSFTSLTPSSLERDVILLAESYLENRPRGNVFGTIMHRAFELVITNRNNIDYQAILNKAIIESLDKIKSFSNDVTSTANYYKAYLRKVLERFVGSEVFCDINKAEKVYCEYPFYYFDDNTWVHGFSDLVLVFKDKVKVIDFKSDSMKENESLEQFETRLYQEYQPQIDLYKESMRKIFDIDLVETELYHLYK